MYHIPSTWSISPTFRRSGLDCTVKPSIELSSFCILFFLLLVFPLALEFPSLSFDGCELDDLFTTGLTAGAGPHRIFSYITIILGLDNVFYFNINKIINLKRLHKLLQIKITTEYYKLTLLATDIATVACIAFSECGPINFECSLMSAVLSTALIIC